jgi:hypothetical protein
MTSDVPQAGSSDPHQYGRERLACNVIVDTKERFGFTGAEACAAQKEAVRGGMYEQRLPR